MRPSRGYISLGMRDMRASPPPVPKDAERRAVNRAHAEAYKERKDAEEARRKRKNLEHDELEKCRQQQRHDGLPVEPSPSPSSTDSSSDDDESEVGRGTLDHLPDIRGMMPGASALKVSTSSIARWVVEAQVAIQRGAVSARVNPKEPVAQGEATEAATKQAGEEAPTPRKAEAIEPGEAEAPSIAEATEGEAEALRIFEAEVADVGAPRTIEAEVAEARAPRTTEAEVAEAGAPRTTEAEAAEAGLGAVEPAAQNAEMEAGQALVPPPVQDPPPSQESAREVEVHSISSDDTSRGKEVANTEAASTTEQPAPTSGKGSLALVRVQPEPRRWDHPRVLWRSRDDPEGEPLFALEDTVEGALGLIRAIPPAGGAVAADSAVRRG
ncbi:uncharacterized protein [Miscanthus floridulus]|uniref:uncharacterized protein n=1 Tax=Miscanthus floridulus TaxID=154761 RepID=UPI00345AB6FC